MNKQWLLLLVLILNHTLLNSVFAAAHSSGEEQGIYEPPHIHLSFSDTDDSTPDDNDSSSNPHDHNKTTHVHAACDPCAVPLSIVSQQVSTQNQNHMAYQLVYLGLSYKPAVPPPTL